MPDWEQFNDPFNFYVTPIGPIGCPLIIQNKPGTPLSWEFRGRQGFNIGPPLQHYRCFHVVDYVINHLLFSDTFEFLHGYLTKTTVSPSDRIVHALNFMSFSIKDAPNDVQHKHL